MLRVERERERAFDEIISLGDGTDRLEGSPESRLPTPVSDDPQNISREGRVPYYLFYPYVALQVTKNHWNVGMFH